MSHQAAGLWVANPQQETDLHPNLPMYIIHLLFEWPFSLGTASRDKEMK